MSREELVRQQVLDAAWTEAEHYCGWSGAPPEWFIRTINAALKAAAALEATPPSPKLGVAERCPVLSEELVEQAWCDLIEKDDRTSPEEYPDMALIKFDELRDIIAGFIELEREALSQLTEKEPSNGQE